MLTPLAAFWLPKFLVLLLQLLNFKLSIFMALIKRILVSLSLIAFFQWLTHPYILFFCGDFNTTIDPVIDHRGCNPDFSWAYNWPRSAANFMTNFDLVDIWRQRYPHVRAFTWNRPCGSQASRLDMSWISSHITDHVQHVEILPFFFGPTIVISTFAFGYHLCPNGGLGFGSLILCCYVMPNMSLPNFGGWQSEKLAFPSLSLWWDAGKARIKDLSHAFSRHSAHQRRSQIQFLRPSLISLQRRLDAGEDVSHLIATLKTELTAVPGRWHSGSRLRTMG